MPRNPNYSDDGVLVRARADHAGGPDPPLRQHRRVSSCRSSTARSSTGSGCSRRTSIEQFRLWQPVTYMFLHARWPSHILFNMLILWMFGVELERTWGTPFFVKYYFVTGVGAGLAVDRRVVLCPSRRRAPPTPRTSSARRARCTDLLLAYAIYYPNRPILMFLFFPVPAKYFVMILGAIAFIMSFARRRVGRGHDPPGRPGHRLPLPARAAAAASPRKSSTAI